MAKKEEREEEEKAGLSAGISSGIVGAIVLAICGALLAIFPIINFGVIGLSSLLALSLGGAALGFCLGFVYGIIPNKGLASFLILVIIVLLGWGAFRTSMIERGALAPLAAAIDLDRIRAAWDKVALYRYCFIADPKCPFFEPWEEPAIHSPEEELAVEVGFEKATLKIRPDNTIELLVKLRVKNPELAELRIKPRCYFKSKNLTAENGGRELSIEKMGSYSYADEFIFPRTQPSESLSTEFYCSGEIPEAADKTVYSEKIIVELERPVSVKTMWPVWIGSVPRKGVVKSEMAHDAPYTVSLASHSDMPFEKGRSYNFQITIRRKAENVQLKRLQHLTLSLPGAIMAECEGLVGLDAELEIREIGYEALKNVTQYDPELEKFIFPCSLYVEDAPREAIRAPIGLEAHYIVYSDHSTRIFKSP